MGDIPNGFYYTTDMDLVKVALVPNIGTKPKPEPLAEFEIPRAYIYLSSHYSEKHYPELPSEIETKAIYIALTYPDGLPYSIALDQQGRKKSAARREGRAVAKTSAEQLRRLLMTAEISASVPNAYQLPTFRPYKYEKYIGNYGTLKRYSTLSFSEVYFGRPEDLIRRIRCPREPENANPMFFCDYYIVLSSRVVAKIAFVDFRANGGLSFAEERIRAFKAAVCHYVNCD